MIYVVRILKDIHNHFGIYLNNKVEDIQATTQHKTIPKPPKFSSKTVGCSYMSCETYNPIPMLIPNYSFTSSPLHATYNRAINVQFFSPYRWFLPPDSLANFANWVSWWSDTIHILCSLVVNLPIQVVLPHILEEFSICSIYVEDLMAVGVENGTAELYPHEYSVVCKVQSYCGEIEVGVTFTRKVFLNLIYMS